MTRMDINFNRYSGGGYGPPRSGARGAQEADGAQPVSLLSQIADAAARLGRSGQRLAATVGLQVDGVPVMRSGSMNAWAAELGWREGVHMREWAGRNRQAA